MRREEVVIGRHGRTTTAAAGAVAAVAVLLSGAGAGSAAESTADVTFVGDSVPASIAYTPSAKRRLSSGLALHLDLRVCRRLVSPSCKHRGSTAPTALEAVESYGPALGDVLIVDVGYNERSDGYREGIDRVMRAALAQGAKAVVWVTLREGRPFYHGTNVAIRAAAGRWKQLRVADWNAHSRGHDWFRPDGLHLTRSGADALAAFLRPYVLRAAGLS
jgi:hypothetical protein